MRLVNSARVYQLLIKKMAPGKKGHSTKPRINLTAMRLGKFWTAGVQVDTAPQAVAATPRYTDGRTRGRSMFDGSCI